MKDIQSNELKVICLEILIHFAEYCEKNDLKYWLEGGSLIGAVRHKGFIPWDDDIDVAMPRYDYEKLLENYTDTEKYKLFCHEKNRKYYYPFAKICDMDTLLIEEHFKCGEDMGVYIDIFPIDGDGNDKKIAIKHLHKCQKIQHKLNNAFLKHFLKTNNKSKDIIRYIRYLFIRIVGVEYYYKKLDKETKKYSYYESYYVANNVWGACDERELLEKSWVEKQIFGEFCKKQFLIPEKYDEFLKSVFGDYMTPPPVEAQKSHHDMLVYKK